MGILDEAIREHLELKRAHGADDSELKQLEDQAFGQSERPGADAALPGAAGSAPDQAAEAPTEFMSQPDLGDDRSPEGQPAEQPLNQEPPATRREPAAGIADIQEAPAKAEPEDDDKRPVAAEEPSAAEHEAIPEPAEPEPAGSHSTEERHAIADQPTQMFDVEEEFAATDAPAPADEDLVAEEMTEAKLGPVEPLAEPAVEDEDDDDFFSEQRLSEELDQALESPIDREPEPEPASEEDEALPPRTDEHVAPVATKADKDEDVLEETPDFLEETPEDDELWFEQKPPKDFDFDD